MHEPERRQGGKDHFDGVDLERLVPAIGDLALNREPAGADLGVEACAHDVDIFWKFPEILDGAGKAFGVRQRLGVPRSGRNQWQAAVDARIIETQFGVVQRRREIAHRQTELALVSGIPVADAWQTRAKARVAIWIRLTVFVVASERIAESEMDDVSARACGVGGREERALRLDPGMKPPELVEAFQGQVVGQADLEIDRRDRSHHVAYLRAGDVDLGNVNRVDRVEAVADEDAFAPVEHLIADSN